MSEAPFLAFLEQAGTVGAIILFVWWRVNRVEKRLDQLERKIDELAARDAELGERVARLEGRWNGLRGAR